MADVYYKVDGDNVYYSNIQEDSDYILRPVESPVTEGKNVIVLLNSKPGYSIEIFEFPENAGYLFYRATNTKFENSSNWSAGSTTRLWRAFYECSNLTELNTEGDVSRCTTFQAMFYGCSSLRQLDLSSGNVSSKAQTFMEMFQGCTSLSGIDLSNFIPSASIMGTVVFPFNNMFFGCTNLTRIFTRDNTDGYKSYPDVSGGGSAMFYNCTKLPNGTGETGLYKACTEFGIFGPGYFTPIGQKHIMEKVVIFMRS